MPLPAATFNVGAAVEGDDVTCGKLRVARNAVNDHVVDGDAHRCGIVVVAQEVRGGTRVRNGRGTHLVKLTGGDARSDGGAKRLVYGDDH